MRRIGQDDFLNGFEEDVPGYDIAPKQTAYRGILMRSRLEVRWAIYFDVLSIEWKYEPDRIRLAGGRVYKPDFWLPGHKVWVEVKPKMFTVEQRRKCKALTQHTGFPCLMLAGLPEYDTHESWAMSSNDLNAEPLVVGFHLNTGKTPEERALFRAQLKIAVYRARHDLAGSISNG